MQLRRALLLFAIVLGLGALAAAIAPPPERTPEDAAPPAARPPEVRPEERRGRTATVNVEFDAVGDPRTASVETGRHVLVTVAAAEPGQASLRGLGLVAPVEPESPARFDLFPERPGRYKAVVTPAGGGAGRTAGVLTVSEAP
jgi:hypothetical protein